MTDQEKIKDLNLGKATILPDGSAFSVASYPLPKDHWLYAQREYEPGEYEPKELPKPILTHAQRNTVIAAIRYAVRGATMCGQETDFDPDALVQNAVYALCGPFVGSAGAPAVPQEALSDEQATFEAWARTQADTWLLVGGLTWSPGTDDYASARTNAAWAAWQARGRYGAQPSGQALQPQPVIGAEELPDTPTRGMSLGQRIAHVGGRENAQGYIEFGSPMAVDALIQHVLRDMTTSTPNGAFQARYRIPGGPWSSWGAVTCGVKGHEQELRYIETEAQPQPSGNAKHLADDPRVGILADSSYINGLRTGYMLGQDGDEAEFQKIIGATRAQISEARADIEDQPSGNASDEPDWLQRLRLEARDLSGRLDRLSRFRDTAGFRMLTDTDQGLLDRQGNQMHALLQTLNQRIHSGAEQHLRSKHHE